MLFLDLEKKQYEWHLTKENELHFYNRVRLKNCFNSHSSEVQLQESKDQKETEMTEIISELKSEIMKLREGQTNIPQSVRVILLLLLSPLLQINLLLQLTNA